MRQELTREEAYFPILHRYQVPTTWYIRGWGAVSYDSICVFFCPVYFGDIKGDHEGS